MSPLDVLHALIVEPPCIMAAVCVTLLNLLTHSDAVSSTMLAGALAGALATAVGRYAHRAARARRTSDDLIKARVDDIMYLLEHGDDLPMRHAIFLVGGLVLVVLTGVVIPLGLAEAMPQTFTFTGMAPSGEAMAGPARALALVARPVCLALGTYLVWPSVLYVLPGEHHRRFMEVAMVVLVCIAVVDYLLFGTNEEIAIALYASGPMPAVGPMPIAINIASVAAACVAMGLASRRLPRVTLGVLVVLAVTAVGLAGVQASIFAGGRTATADDATVRQEVDQPHFTLSRTGQNVVVLMLDRGMGEYIPYIMNEKPELKEQFSGFTYYPNTMSFGGSTNFGSPALLGGYEYTPIEMNRRSTERLQDKHDEALKVMPVLFDQSGYDVTVCDPPYAGYQWTPDLSIYSDHPRIHAYNTMGYFTGMPPSDPSSNQRITGVDCDLFRMAVARALPLPCRSSLYRSNATYRYGSEPPGRGAPLEVSTTNGQTYSSDALIADGGTDVFLRSYYALGNMSTMTQVDDSSIGSFLMMANDTTHDPTLLQEPS